MTTELKIDGLTVVPTSSFLLAVEVITKSGLLQEFGEFLKNKGEDKIYLSRSVMDMAQSFLSEKKGDANVFGDLKDDADKIIQCAGCCNGCSVEV